MIALKIVNWIIACTSEAETLVSGEAECLLVIGQDKRSILFGVTFSFNTNQRVLRLINHRWMDGQAVGRTGKGKDEGMNKAWKEEKKGRRIEGGTKGRRWDGGRERERERGKKGGREREREGGIEEAGKKGGRDGWKGARSERREDGRMNE